MKVNDKKIMGSQIVEVLTPSNPITNKKKVLELGFEVNINLPATKVLEYRKISITRGVLQYLVDFLNGTIQKNPNIIKLIVTQKEIDNYLVMKGIPIQKLEDIDDEHRFEIDMNRFENIYTDHIEIDGPNKINVGIYIHILKHTILNPNAWHNNIKQIDATDLRQCAGAYKYIANSLKFEITGHMRFKEVSAHYETKVVLINPEKIKWFWNGNTYYFPFNDRMNDPFINKLGSFSS